jgi:PAS domain S-box-containing protein
MISTHWTAPHRPSPQALQRLDLYARRAGDFIERCKIEDSLRDAKERYELVFAGAGAAIWDWDVPAKRVVYSARWKEMRGLADDEVTDSEEEWSRGIHPDDVARVRSAIEEHFAGRTPAFAEEYRVRHKDGRWIWILDRGLARRDAAGRVIRMAGSETDITERKQAEEELRESERRLELAMSAGRMGAWEWDVRTGRIYWSPGLERLHGLAPGTFGGAFDDFIRDIHPDDAPMVLAAIERALAGAGDYHVIYRAKSGARRWFEAFGSLARGADGAPQRMVGVCIDVTARKQAEETQRLLLSELNHRVKNTLAIVQAIAHRTLAEAGDPADFAASFSGRIRSLARVHALLSETSWQGADLGALIRDQLLAGPADESRLTASGPPVRLDPQTALTVALMLHELGTNSVKYGALSAAGGAVAIDWSMGAALHIRWAERGGPPVAPPTKRGFGVTLIEQGAKGRGGDAKMSWTDEGISWDIELPLADQDRAAAAPSAPPALDARPRGAPANLAGRRFLIVEDEPLIALDIAAALQSADAEIEGPIGTATEAVGVIERARLDGALLDANLHGRPVGDIARALTRRNLPFVFVTGYGRDGLPEAFQQAAILSKPFSRQQVIDAAERLIAVDPARR